jgi:hypothetical protein
MKRIDALQALVRFDKPLGEVFETLSQYPWDGEELVVLSCAHVASVLNRFMNGTISAADVENWADAIEGRDDIGFDAESRDLLKDAIWELANPILTNELSRDSAKVLINRMKS